MNLLARFLIAAVVWPLGLTAAILLVSPPARMPDRAFQTLAIAAVGSITGFGAVRLADAMRRVARRREEEQSP